MGLSRDWIKTEQSGLSLGERAGFSKDDMDAFLNGKTVNKKEENTQEAQGEDEGLSLFGLDGDTPVEEISNEDLTKVAQGVFNDNPAVSSVEVKKDEKDTEDKIEAEFKSGKIDYDTACERLEELIGCDRSDAQGIVDLWDTKTQEIVKKQLAKDKNKKSENDLDMFSGVEQGKVPQVNNSVGILDTVEKIQEAGGILFTFAEDYTDNSILENSEKIRLIHNLNNIRPVADVDVKPLILDEFNLCGWEYGKVSINNKELDGIKVKHIIKIFKNGNLLIKRLGVAFMTPPEGLQGDFKPIDGTKSQYAQYIKTYLGKEFPIIWEWNLPQVEVGGDYQLFDMTSQKNNWKNHIKYRFLEKAVTYAIKNEIKEKELISSEIKSKDIAELEKKGYILSKTGYMHKKDEDDIKGNGIYLQLAVSGMDDWWSNKRIYCEEYKSEEAEEFLDSDAKTKFSQIKQFAKAKNSAKLKELGKEYSRLSTFYENKVFNSIYYGFIQNNRKSIKINETGKLEGDKFKGKKFRILSNVKIEGV